MAGPVQGEADFHVLSKGVTMSPTAQKTSQFVVCIGRRLPRWPAPCTTMTQALAPAVDTAGVVQLWRQASGEI